jgi:hypothetical protein
VSVVGSAFASMQSTSRSAADADCCFARKAVATTERSSVPDASAFHAKQQQPAAERVSDGTRTRGRLDHNTLRFQLVTARSEKCRFEGHLPSSGRY